MPHLTQQISSGGPIVELFVGTSVPRAEALRRSRLPVPASVTIRGLIDPGASWTCMDPSVLRLLKWTSTGTTPVHTPSTRSGLPHVASQFDISIILPHPMNNRIFPAMPVIESELLHHGIHALIGRDVLDFCLLTYDGPFKTFCVAF